MKKVVVLSGAGISQESGIKTFRDADGLWEGHDIQEVASFDGFMRNQNLVLDFYNQRRRQLLEVEPNAAHYSLVALEQSYEVCIITQNVDDLHERAGSKDVLHLHGELLKVRSLKNEHIVLDWRKDLVMGDLASDGAQLRPHIVWFGEMVPLLEDAVQIVATADIVIIVGTSMQVYPAASLCAYAPSGAEMYYVDPKPKMNHELRLAQNLKLIEEKAGVGLPVLVKDLLAVV